MRRPLFLLNLLGVLPTLAFHRLVGSWKPTEPSKYHPTLHLDSDGSTLRCVTSLKGCEIVCRVHTDPHDDSLLVIESIGALGLPPVRSVPWGDIALFLSVRSACPIRVAIVHHAESDSVTALWRFRKRTQSVVLRRIFSDADDKCVDEQNPI